jgi:hypothetical protein
MGSARKLCANSSNRLWDRPAQGSVAWACLAYREKRCAGCLDLEAYNAALAALEAPGRCLIGVRSKRSSRILNV